MEMDGWHRDCDSNPLRDGYGFIPPSINQTSTDVRESVTVVLRGLITNASNTTIHRTRKPTDATREHRRIHSETHKQKTSQSINHVPVLARLGTFTTPSPSSSTPSPASSSSRGSSLTSSSAASARTPPTSPVSSSFDRILDRRCARVHRRMRTAKPTDPRVPTETNGCNGNVEIRAREIHPSASDLSPAFASRESGPFTPSSVVARVRWFVGTIRRKFFRQSALFPSFMYRRVGVKNRALVGRARRTRNAAERASNRAPSLNQINWNETRVASIHPRDVSIDEKKSLMFYAPHHAMSWSTRPSVRRA